MFLAVESLSVSFSEAILSLLHFLLYKCLYFRRYDEDEAKSNRDNQEQSRAALQRYLFYCNR